MEDILDDPKLAECIPSACWLFIQILAMLNRSKSRDGLLTIPSRALNGLTGRDRTATDKLLASLQQAGIILYKRHGMSTRIEVPKWAKNQGFAPSKLRPGSVETPSPTPTPTPNKKREEKKEPAAAAASLFPPRGNGKPKPEKKPKRTPFPEPFPLDLRARLGTWAEKHDFAPHQVAHAIDAVRDWAVSNGKVKVDWVAAIQGAMRAGWALPKPGGSSGDVQSRALAIVNRDRAAEKERNRAQ